MTQTQTPPSFGPPTGQRKGLAGLAGMSTTAGVGLSDYRAIHPFAVASLITGVASILVWLHPLLYILPPLAVVFGLWAFWQIRRSNGTQGGMLLAAVGALLGLVLGSALLVTQIQEERRDRTYRSEIQQVFTTMGEALARDDYPGAFALMAEPFQDDIDFIPYKERVSGILGASRVTGARSNGLASIKVDPEGRVTAEAVLIIERQGAEPLRDTVLLERTGNGWRIRHMAGWFPIQPGGRAGTGSPS